LTNEQASLPPGYEGLHANNGAHGARRITPKGVRGVFSRLTPRHWGWIIFKLLVGVAWPLALIFTTPTTVLATVGWVIFLIALTALGGGLLSVIGIVMSAQRGAAGVIGLSVELAGLCLFIVGPICYAIINLALTVTGYHNFHGYQFLPSAVFSTAMVSAIVNRILIVAPLRSREAHDTTKDR
jgi:hypothetical protein